METKNINKFLKKLNRRIVVCMAELTVCVAVTLNLELIDFVLNDQMCWGFVILVCILVPH